MSTEKRNSQCLNIILLPLFFMFLSACDSNTQELDPETATAKLKTFSESMDMDADDIVEIRVLIKAGADVNAAHANGRTALTQAATQGHTEIVKALLDAGANMNANNTYGNRTALWMAAVRGHTETVKTLLEAGADVNAKIHLDGKDYTALDSAKQLGHTEVIKILKEYGAEE